MRILIVEDNKDHQILLRRVLEEYYRDPQINIANSLKNAKDELKRSYYDSIILDYRLGDGDGIELIKWIRESGIDTPIIMVTSMQDIKLAVNAIKLGAYDYLCKDEESFNRIPILIKKAVDEFELREKLRRAELRYKTLIEGMKEAILLINDKGELLFVSKSIESLTGYNEEYFKRNLFNLLSGNSRKRFYQNITRLLEGEDVEPFIIRFYKKDGEMIYLEVNPSRFKYNNKDVGVIETLQDVTNRVLLEKAIDLERRKVTDILNSMIDGVYVVDENYNLIFLNNALVKKYGELKKNTKCYKLFYGRKVPCPFCKWEKVKKGFTVRWELKDEDGFTYDIVSTPLRNPDGSISNLSIMRDISKRKEAEEKLIEQSRRINMTNKELKETIRRLEETKEQLIRTEKLASLGKLISGVAHEINNPLFSAMGYSELLLMDMPGNDERREKVKYILDSIKRARSIIEDLLKFARREEIKKELLNINDVIRSTIVLRSYSFKVNNIKLVTDLNENIPPIKGNFSQLQQVMLNILINAEQAIKETNNNGIIKIKTRYNGQRQSVDIEISNNGPKIPDEIVDKIFDPFFSTKDVGEGTGLGLSTSFGIVRDHEGEINVKSDDSWTVFTVTIPAEKEKNNLTMDDGDLFNLEMAKNYKNNNEKALIVDDEEIIIKLMRDFLEQRGFTVFAANSGEKAIDILNNEEIDIIISDIKMPGMDGIKFYNKIKNYNPGLLDRLIFITGDTVSEETLSFLDSSGVSFLRKPFTFNEILKAIDGIEKIKRKSS